MILSASYDEIIGLVREKTGQSVGIRYKNPDTLTVSYNASIPLPIFSFPLARTLSADVRLVELSGPRAVLQVDAGMAGNMALDMVSKKLLARLPEGLVEQFSGGRAVLNLAAVPQFKTLFDRMTVNALTFHDRSLSIDAAIK